jgi:tetratricopeptide (TPR) repeat protein
MEGIMITATELLSKGEYLEERGDYVRARRMYEKALSIQERNLGGDGLELVPYLYNLGLIEVALENKREAQIVLRRLLNILIEEHGEHHEDVVEIFGFMEEIRPRRLFDPAV